ncbi:hypothetical protein ACM66B_004596 [Microbotryomycetes sp. NB124-2]
MLTTLVLQAASAPDFAESSAIFAVSSRGKVHPITTCLGASLPSDLVILGTSARSSVVITHFEDRNANGNALLRQCNVTTLESLPVSPYPAVLGAQVACFMFNEALEPVIERGHVIEYKDSAGREARTGTYDELAQMATSVLCPPGSSGGPVIDPNGAVCAVVTSSVMAYGDKFRRGIATPAERIYEMFELPGLSHL